MRYTLLSGTGNLFAAVDGFRDEIPSDPAAVARSICAPTDRGGLDPRPDGLLIATRARAGGDCAMLIYNADGSRAETCGNGLRCVAKLVAERGHVAGDRFVIESDARPCAAEVERNAGRVTRARVHMGSPRIVARKEELVAAGNAFVAMLVDVGNPHCVLIVPDERTMPVATIGPALETHARFPHGTNVEFLALRDGALHLRIWERGVGETQACGSGACAAAISAIEHRIAAWPVQLHVPGGVLEVESDGAGGVWLGGVVEELGTGEWSARTTPSDARARSERGVSGRG